MMLFIVLALLGAVSGSFAGAQVWRLRARQLAEDKRAGESVDTKEYKKLAPLMKQKTTKDRSKCLKCHHQLAWYDLLPIISWLSLAGRCRYCRRFIGWTEIILELSLAGLFVASALVWPMELTSPAQIALFVIWLVALVLLAILFVYDLRWLLLPDVANVPFILLGALFAAINLLSSNDLKSSLVSLLGSVFILSGLYFLLYLFSRARYGEDKSWVGFGDIKLGLGLSLFLGNWLLAFAALFAANLIGTIIVLPALLSGKVKGNSRISFGPLLVLGFLVVWLFEQNILELYQFIL